MNKLKVFGGLSLATMGLLIGVFAGQKNEIKKAVGYSMSDLPTTIDLNDTSASSIRNYYSSLSSLSESERQGTNLLKNLKTILKTNQKYYSYDSGSAIWQIYEISDRDWSLSPASSTTYGTYNSSENKIYNYVYGTSNSNSKNNPYLHALYINRNVTNQVKAWGNHNQDEWGINREHVWPKAEGFDGSDVNDGTSGGARGDPMHLMAGNGYSNNIHSNYYYGYVGSITTNCGTKYSNQTGNLLGTSKTKGSGTVFEPQDCDKGDIARAIFYMVARYNYLSGSDSDGINSNNPNLALTNNITDYSSSAYCSTTSKTAKMGILTDLLAWHHADPVDEFEIHRNNLLYTNFTNNRNPFIDFPEWVDYIWGTAVYDGTSYQSYNSEPTGYAKPSSDTINGYNSSSISEPTINSVTMNPTSLELDLNGTTSGSLTATVDVSNGAAQTVNWTVEPSGQGVTVSNNGVVNAASDAVTGTYFVRAISTVDHSKYGTCTVTLVDSSQQSGELFYVNASITLGDYSSSITVNGKTGAKVGTSYNSGSISIDVPSGTISLKFYAASWNDVSDLSISISGATVTPSSVKLLPDSAISGSNDSITLTGSEDSYLFTFDLSGVNQNTTITITPNTSKRFLLWGAQYSTGSTPIEPTAIFASVENDLYYVGQTITKSDIVLKDDLDNKIIDFDFSDYTFLYSDSEDGSETTLKEFEIIYNNFETTLEVYVSRKQYGTPNDSLEYLASDFASLNTFYKSNQEINVNGTELLVSGYYFSNGKKLSLSNGQYSAPGSVKNASPYPTGITNVTVAGASPSPDIQLSVDGRNWVDLSTVSSSIEYYYFKLFYKDTAQTNYINISSITISFQGESPYNVSNYIMYEDTDNQCLSKFQTAIDMLNTMSLTNKQLFMSSDDYVVSTARTRLQAWATSQGKTISLSDGNIISSTNQSMSFIANETESSTMIVVLVISSLSLLAIGVFSLKIKKKEKHI